MAHTRWALRMLSGSSATSPCYSKTNQHHHWSLTVKVRERERERERGREADTNEQFQIRHKNENQKKKNASLQWGDGLHWFVDFMGERNKKHENVQSHL